MEAEVAAPAVDPDRQAQHAAADDLSTTLRQLIVASATSSPLSSAPPTPRLDTPRRPSHPATSPLQQNAFSPRPPTLRRTSSAMTLGNGQRPTSSPKLIRKGSRTSVGGQPEELEKRPTPKRSISNLIANLREAQSTMESIEEPVVLTAAQIAADHFMRELITNARQDTSAETVVIFHDACYGHRYSRLKSTKSTLSMIVERPERILASVLGASAAYVRLGEHNAGAKNAPHPERNRAAPPPFKIRRTARSIDITSSYVTNVHGTAWMSELQTMCHSAADKLATGVKELSRSSTPTAPEKRKLHEGDLYLAAESLEAFQGALGGVADAVDNVFHPTSQTKRAFVAVRPPGHHCSADYPSGFCWLNNVHVGIEYAAQTYDLTHAAILDFDLHHGDGSQAITWSRNSKNNEKRWNAKPNSKLKLSPDIGYYSLHDINSYPCEMGDDEKVQAASLCIENAHGQSIWNVHLQPWKTEEEFWQLYEERYCILLEKARVFLQHHTARLRTEGKVQPKAAIFISAGFDASEWEGAGMQRHKVNVPTEFYARFTRDIVKLAQEPGLGCEGRVISVLEGGYSDRALCSGVLSHLSGLCASPVSADKTDNTQLDDLMNGLRIGDGANLHYDKSWWSAANLTALEHKINPPPPPVQGKRVRTGPQPTYATPTESFAYKVIDPAKFARSISGTMREMPMPVRAPTPPAPDVDWVVATQELSKLLIPTDRQTRSFTPEELGGVRTKKERQSVMPVFPTAEEATKPRQLRDRKVKVPAAATYAESTHSDELESVRSVSRSSNRRQTMHELPSAASEPAPEQTRQRRPPSRRLSAGSALSSMDGIMEDVAPPVPAMPAFPPTSNGANGTMKPPPMPAPVPAGIQMKKTRAAPSKPPAKAPVSIAVPKSTFSSTNPSPTLSAPSINGTTAPTPSGNDVDSLTSGMKKVTLKVPSREEHDRKQKEREAAERRARALKGAETRRVNAAAKKAAKEGAGAQQVSRMAPPAAPDLDGTVSTAASTEPPAVSGAVQSHSILATPALSVNGEVEISAPQSEVTTPEHFVNGRPEANAPATTDFTDPVPVSEVHQQAADQAPLPIAPVATTPSEIDVQIPEPTTTAQQISPTTIPDSAARQLIQEHDRATNGTHAALQSRHNSSSSPTMRSPSINNSGKKKLPVFSSTGPIPFAPAATSAPSLSSRRSLSSLRTSKSPPKSAWKSRPSNGPESLDDGNGVSRSMLGDLKDDVVLVRTPEPKPEGDVWEVPETPQR